MLARALRKSVDVDAVVRCRRTALILVSSILALTGCAATTGTRTGQLGPLSDHQHLVTLVVTEDTTVVRSECPFMLAAGSILGCQTSREVKTSGGSATRVVKIVRFTDRLPSAMAFEIDIHELCHAVAALQPIDDPCHVGNGGVVEHYPSAAPRGLFTR
jgi:hypothetical protein